MQNRLASAGLLGPRERPVQAARYEDRAVGELRRPALRGAAHVAARTRRRLSGRGPRPGADHSRRGRRRRADPAGPGDHAERAAAAVHRRIPRAAGQAAGGGPAQRAAAGHARGVGPDHAGLDLPALSRWGPALALVDSVNRRTARAYQRVICTTAWAAAEFERIGAANLVRASLGVDLATFAPPHADQQGTRIRDAYAAPGETLLVHAGRLSPEKKPQRSLNTLATLRANGLPARLVVAGDGPLRRRLERRATRDRLPVTFAGFLPGRTDLAALLASADVAIAPGPAETFGLAGLEALACGTPVVVSAESALPEVVGEAGAAVAGEDLSAGVTTVLSRPEAARRAAARARAERFGWPAAVQAFLAIHEAVAADEVGKAAPVQDEVEAGTGARATVTAKGRPA